MVNIDSAEVDLFKNDWFLLPDMFDFLCGANINVGTYRSVYNCSLDPRYVVKVERPVDKSFNFNNVTEFDIWSNIKANHKEYAKFLAPCSRISGCGRLLLMEKTMPVKAEELPKMIPYFLCDTKLINWGKLGRRVVCHDYGNHRFYSAIQKNKLVKAVWNT